MSSKFSPAKKIVFVTSRPLCEPPLHNRVMPLIKLLLCLGYEVCLVCPKHVENAELRAPGVQLQEVTIPPARHRNFIKRAMSESRDSLLLLKRAKAIQADVWLVTIPSMFLAFLAPLILVRRKVVLDIRDLSWEYLAEKQPLQRLGKRIFRAAFQFSLPFFRAAVVTNPTELGYVAKHWRGSSPPLMVGNGIERDKFNSLAGLKSPEKGLAVTYIGNVGLAQRLDTLIEAAERLPEVRFTIVGTGIDFERIVRFVAERKLHNVRLTGRISWESVLGFYNTANVLYAQLAPDYSGAVPSKLYEYLATGKHIIYGGEGEAARTLSRFDHHQLIPPCDVDALVAAITVYEKSPDKHQVSQLNRDRVGSLHLREEASAQLIRCINSIASEQ